MLSRVAECLYWMSRYVERAENVARMVDVHQRLMLDIPSKQSQQICKDWLPLASTLGDESSYRQSHRKRDAETVTEFLVFDLQNLNSVASCVRAARENARSVREIISPEMWEQINRTYLWLCSRSAHQHYEKNNYDFFQRTEKTLQLFQGITDHTMLHGDGWEFIQIGKFLERADKTARFLDDKFHLLRPPEERRDDLFEWVAVLNCCSARQTYQRIYLSTVNKLRVAELLLVNEYFPRSVRFCVMNVDDSLRRLSGVAPGHFSNLAEKISGRLLADLCFSTIDDLCAPGLHHAMDDLQLKINQIGNAIYDTYIHHPAFVELASPRVSLVVPQQ